MDGEQRLVAGVVPVVVVEQPEVVDVDQGDAERQAGRPGALDLVCEVRHERAVVERTGERVSMGRLEELCGLAADPCLGGPEDEEEQGRRDEAGAERDQDDVAADVAEPGQDRGGVAPDDDDAADVAVGLDREVLADEGGRGQRQGAGCGGRLCDRHERRLRRPASGRLEDRIAAGDRLRQTPGSLAATTVPSGRRISTRRISSLRVRAASCVSSVATRDALGGDASKSVVRTWAFTNARVVAASLPTTLFSVAVEK